MYYLNYFFLFSIIGHFVETHVYLDYESGILFGCWTPIYGFGTIIILSIYNFINKKWSLNKVTKFFIVFFIGFILLSILEIIGGYLIEWIFHVTFWDYSHLKFPITKYTSLEMSFVWGMCSILVIYFLKPVFDKLIKYIPKFITYIFIILFIIDCLYTLNLK